MRARSLFTTPMACKTARWIPAARERSALARTRQFRWGATGCQCPRLQWCGLTVGGNNSSTTFSGSLSGGTLAMVGAGTLTLTNTNTLANLTFNGGAISGGTINFNSSSGTTLSNNAAGVTTMSSALNLTGGAQYWTGNAGGTLAITGSVADGSGGLYLRSGNYHLLRHGLMSFTGTGEYFTVGYNDTASFYQSGGSVYAGRGTTGYAMYLGQTGTAAGLTASCSYAITGGTLTSHGALDFGYTAGVTSTLTINGPSAVVNVDGTSPTGINLNNAGTAAQTLNLQSGELPPTQSW